VVDFCFCFYNGRFIDCHIQRYIRWVDEVCFFISVFLLSLIPVYFNGIFSVLVLNEKEIKYSGTSFYNAGLKFRFKAIEWKRIIDIKKIKLENNSSTEYIVFSTTKVLEGEKVKENFKHNFCLYKPSKKICDAILLHLHKIPCYEDNKEQIDNIFQRTRV